MENLFMRVGKDIKFSLISPPHHTLIKMFSMVSISIHIFVNKFSLTCPPTLEKLFKMMRVGVDIRENIFTKVGLGWNIKFFLISPPKLINIFFILSPPNP